MSFVASPSVQKYAGDMGVDLALLARDTGRHAIAREDVDAFLGRGDAAPSAGMTQATKSADAARYWDVDHAQHGPVTSEPMPRMAQVAAANLAAANAMIPQVTHHDRADMRAVERFRKAMKDEAAARGIRLTALAFHIRTLARCLTEFPRFNASLSAAGDVLILKQFVHIGIAVDTPHGLMVPVLRNVDRMGLWQIAAGIADLAARAQARKVRPEEMGGASMSISNLGGDRRHRLHPDREPARGGDPRSDPDRNAPGVGERRLGAGADGAA